MNGQGWAAAALVALLVPLTMVLLLRDLTRAVHRQRMRRLLAPHAAAFTALKATTALTLLPSVRQAIAAAADMERAMRNLQTTLHNPNKC